jgi:cell division initiation protein
MRDNDGAARRSELRGSRRPVEWRVQEGKAAMQISPMDIQHQTFRRRFRGYDVAEVRTYLNLVAEELAQLQRVHASLQQEAQGLRLVVDEHRQREQVLKNTLLTAQRMSEELREAGRKQAEVTVKEAELQAERLLELSVGRAKEVERETLELRALRRTLRTDIRALIQRLTHILDLEEEAEAQDNLRFMGRREEAK